HRGVEKLCEKLTYVQITPIVDKNDYVAPMTNEQAVNLAVEALAGIEVPRRARYLRTILAELQRVASHLLWLGTFAIDLGGALGGGTSLFMYCFRERELIMDLFEELTGSRFHYNTHTPGGNRHDVPEGWGAKVKQVMRLIEGRLDEYTAVLDHPIFEARTKDIGVIDAELALGLGLSGPILRASGVDHDLRRDAPYHAYDEIELNVPVAAEGDCHARYRVRLAEMRESIRVVLAMMDGLPEGPINGGRAIKTPVQVKIKSGQAYVALETPRGELGTYVIGGGDNRHASPYRFKIRSPSLHAVSALPWVLPGHQVSDVVAILGSLDPILGEVDR
ncbi:MAG: NADPH-quinone oxidoreductase, partial [Myxococcales bacterium]|nr:NADPH-quinone oxidoreductase [Myxococcales bacterium]